MNGSGDFDYNNYWDFISTCDQSEGKETLKDLSKEAYPLFKQYLDSLYFIEANFIYLNLVMEVSQNTIADLFDLSQLGVSKRVRGGVKKINQVLQRPETNRNRIRQDFTVLLPEYQTEQAVLYYHYKTYSLVAELLGMSNISVRNKILGIIDNLKLIAEADDTEIMELINEPQQGVDDPHYYRLMAERYHKYLEILGNSNNYGDYFFKAGIR